MSIADKAIANAIPCEMVKYAYRQNKDGVVVSFVVHPNDIPAALATSRIGARYVVALVEIGDDEKPVDHKEASPAPRQDVQLQPDVTKGRLPWEAIQPAAQAAIRCNDAVFRTFLTEVHSFRPRAGDDHADEAAEFLRCIFGINSRAELGTDHRKRVLWKQLDDQFQAWKAAEHA